METTKNNNEFMEYLINVSRVAKTVKGGRRISLVAFMVVGNGKGLVGVGKGRGKEAATAIKKALAAARKNVKQFPLFEGRTLNHDVKAKKGAGQVVLRSAHPGTGIIAGGSIRLLFEAMGVRDVVCKSIGSNNSYNLVWATLKALENLTTPKYVAMKRGKKLKNMKVI